jgi:hypothetical protein
VGTASLHPKEHYFIAWRRAGYIECAGWYRKRTMLERVGRQLVNNQCHCRAGFLSNVNPKHRNTDVIIGREQNGK